MLVALVDQPGMHFGLIEILLALHRPGKITAAGYRCSGGVAGLGGVGRGTLRREHPVLFSPEHAAGAAAMASGDVRARAYRAEHPDQVDLVDFSHFTDGADLDAPADLHLLHRPEQHAAPEPG